MSDPFFLPDPDPNPAETSPGRYDLGDLDGVRIAVVIHADGQRDMHLLTTEDNDPVAVFQFSEEQALAIAAALGGAGP